MAASSSSNDDDTSRALAKRPRTTGAHAPRAAGSHARTPDYGGSDPPPVPNESTAIAFSEVRVRTETGIAFVMDLTFLDHAARCIQSTMDDLVRCYIILHAGTGQKMEPNIRCYVGDGVNYPININSLFGDDFLEAAPTTFNWSNIKLLTIKYAALDWYTDLLLMNVYSYIYGLLLSRVVLLSSYLIVKSEATATATSTVLDPWIEHVKAILKRFYAFKPLADVGDTNLKAITTIVVYLNKFIRWGNNQKISSDQPKISSADLKEYQRVYEQRHEHLRTMNFFNYGIIAPLFHVLFAMQPGSGEGTTVKAEDVAQARVQRVKEIYRNPEFIKQFDIASKGYDKLRGLTYDAIKPEEATQKVLNAIRTFVTDVLIARPFVPVRTSKMKLAANRFAVFRFLVERTLIGYSDIGSVFNYIGGYNANAAKMVADKLVRGHGKLNIADNEFTRDFFVYVAAQFVAYAHDPFRYVLKVYADYTEHLDSFGGIQAMYKRHAGKPVSAMENDADFNQAFEAYRSAVATGKSLVTKVIEAIDAVFIYPIAVSLVYPFEPDREPFEIVEHPPEIAMRRLHNAINPDDEKLPTMYEMFVRLVDRIEPVFVDADKKTAIKARLNERLGLANSIYKRHSKAFVVDEDSKIFYEISLRMTTNCSNFLRHEDG